MDSAEWLETTSVCIIQFINIDMAIGLPGKNGVISGMRGSCEVVVEINLVKAMREGHLPFFISENKVVLTPGIGDKGYLPPKYFR